MGAASGAGIAIGAYFAFYGAASNLLARHTDMAPGGVAFVAGGVAAAGGSVVKVPLAVCIRSVQVQQESFMLNALKLCSPTLQRWLMTAIMFRHKLPYNSLPDLTRTLRVPLYRAAILQEQLPLAVYILTVQVQPSLSRYSRQLLTAECPAALLPLQCSNDGSQPGQCASGSLHSYERALAPLLCVWRLWPVIQHSEGAVSSRCPWQSASALFSFSKTFQLPGNPLLYPCPSSLYLVVLACVACGANGRRQSSGLLLLLTKAFMIARQEVWRKRQGVSMAVCICVI